MRDQGSSTLERAEALGAAGVPAIMSWGLHVTSQLLMLLEPFTSIQSVPDSTSEERGSYRQ